jgi:crotonobetainyl-CoA:carnitine CoA-transferase CaiB-like acyl-CoA transferase
MKPLEDVRIVAIEQYGAGPWGSMHLADLGADVIKIEEPTAGGDVGRFVPPYAEDGDSLFFETFNRNKRSIDLDITTQAGRSVLEELVGVSDAVYSNLRGDVPAKLRIRYEDLAHINPRIVCCSLSAFGMSGPRTGEPGYDYVIQGMAGWMDLTGEPGGPPTKAGLSLVDFSGGFVAALATIVGIHAARRDGVGMDCDVSLFETALSLLTYPATWHLTRGFTPERTAHSAHPTLVPFQNFATADGWMVVGCAKEKFWRTLTDVIDSRELADDPRFEDFAARYRHRDALIPLLESVFLTRDTASWLEALGTAGVPCGPVNGVAEALRDPQAEARDAVVETAHPRFGPVRQMASPVRVGAPRTAHLPAPRRNADADDVLEELLGFSAERVAELREAGAFGPREGGAPVEGEGS